MFRLVLVVFFGGERSDEAVHAHESPGIMVWPLRVLAVFSAIGGFIGIEGVYQQFARPEHAHHIEKFTGQLLEPFNSSPLGAFIGLGAVFFGFFLALGLYRGAAADPLPAKLGWLSRAMRNRFYFDELYENVLIPCTQEALASLANVIDRWIISGFAVRGTQGVTELFGRALRLFQTGNIQTYAFLLVAGVALVVCWVLMK
jgi:NADH-quinone oxidoreductase subunit L